MIIQSSILGTYCIRILAGWAILHGFLTSVGGIERWSSPSYDIVRIVPGSPYTWGIILMIGGLLALWASMAGVDYILEKKFGKIVVRLSYKVIKNSGLWVIGFWSFFFFVLFTTTAFTHSGLSLASGDRDLAICILAIMMTKAREPRL